MVITIAPFEHAWAGGTGGWGTCEEEEEEGRPFLPHPVLPCILPPICLSTPPFLPWRASPCQMPALFTGERRRRGPYLYYPLTGALLQRKVEGR